MNPPSTTGQWLSPRDGSRWWFDSGSVALDFAYTGAEPLGYPEQLPSGAELALWLGERFEGVNDDIGERELQDALLLRTAIAHAAITTSRGAGPRPDDVDTINLYAAIPDIPPALAGGTRQAGRSRVRAAQALSTMAREAVALFTVEARERIRTCSADDCSVIFVDESRSANRRWCSMARCGNRVKVRNHRSRARSRTN